RRFVPLFRVLPPPTRLEGVPSLPNLSSRHRRGPMPFDEDRRCQGGKPPMPAIFHSHRCLARWLSAIVLLALPLSIQAQPGTSPQQPKYLAARVFSIPFDVNWSKYRQLKLYASANGGTSWELHTTAQSPQRGFEV